MSGEMNISFRVTGKTGKPLPAEELDRQLIKIHKLLLANAPSTISDIDVSAALTTGRVDFSMWIEGLDSDAAEIVAALNLIVPAIAAIGGEPRLGQLLGRARPKRAATRAKKTRPKYELVGA